MTDARLLGRHLIWASTTPAARNQDFNIVDGDVFRWSWMWQRLAQWFGIEAAPFPERDLFAGATVEGCGSCVGKDCG